jgi:hypothetical protein
VLLRSYEHWLEETVNEMQVLALDSATAGLDVSLRCVRIALASGATRHRLDWFIRGEPHAVAWHRVRGCFNRIPAPLRAYLQQCNARARELNALESVFRYAVSQLATYLEHGTVKVKGSTACETSEWSRRVASGRVIRRTQSSHSKNLIVGSAFVSKGQTFDERSPQWASTQN